MKKFFAICLVFCFAIIGYAQSGKGESKFIEVVGTAEKNVVADQLVLSISVGEYFKDAEQKNKVSIENVEQQLFKELNKIGVLSDNIKISNLDNYRMMNDKKEKYYLISKSFEITFDDIEKMNLLFKSLDARSINHMNISNRISKDIVQYRKEVRIAALKAAKDKAAYLLESLNKELGEVISISEMNMNDFNTYGKLSNVVLSASSYDSNQLDMLRSINIKYDIKVKFEIK